MTEHTLKTIDRYFDAIATGHKTFEVRKNDRAFQKGDILILERWDETRLGPQQTIPKQIIRKRISYLLQGGQFGIEPAYCVLGLADVTQPTPSQE